jgi:uncharacterized protein YdeI (YjbR/CyaY-like superfamily)
MEITDTLHVTQRAEWRQWLAANHATAKAIWLVSYTRKSGKPGLNYLDAVEEALCFGWIDGIVKKLEADRNAQRFTPRRPKSNWTELNKERARRLIASGQMTPAGLAVLPDLSVDSFHFPEDILAALQADPQAWANYQSFPPLYQRIRVAYIDDMRRQPDEFQKRLARFVKMTRENKLIGSIK